MTDIRISTADAIRPARRRRGSSLRRLLRSPLGMAALVADVALLWLVIFGPIIWGTAANAYDTLAINSGPIPGHPFGTDGLGRDIGLRVLVAARFSLELAFAATLVGVLLGLILGTIPVVTGPRTSRAFVAVVNVAVAFPGILLAMFFATILGIGAFSAVLALGLATSPAYARLTQNLAAGIANRDYVSAARSLGVSKARIIARHILPNIAETIIINVTLGAGGILLAFAGLSFLGLGVQAPQYDWGRMLQDGLNGIYVNAWAALLPGAAIVLAGLALNLTGEAAAQLAGRRVTVIRRRWLNLPLSTTLKARSGATLPVGEDDDDDEVLTVRDLTVRFPAGRRDSVMPVRGVSFTVRRGESVGIVGESGSGKSLTALAIAGLIDDPGRVDATQLTFEKVDMLGRLSTVDRRILGTRMAVVFQDPSSSLNPVMRVGAQLTEATLAHERIPRRWVLTRAVDRLRSVGVPAPEHRARQYPHEYSGGMRQRAMIAMGLMGSPSLLIADEPTTALDTTVQRRVLGLIAGIRQEFGTALLLISHDMAVVSAMCSRVVVMYAGKIVEDVDTASLLAGPRHPYTRALLGTVPDMETAKDHPLATIGGNPPSPSAFPPGCAFAPRCPFATEKCQTEPPLEKTSDGGQVACWHPCDDRQPAPAGRGEP